MIILWWGQREPTRATTRTSPAWIDIDVDIWGVAATALMLELLQL